MLRSRPRRTGAVVVESAIIYPVLLILVLGIVLVGLTVFRYQECAHAAREGARWASVHGSTWAAEQKLPATTQQDVIDNAVSPQFAGIPSGTEMTCPVTGLSQVVSRSNTVSVTVTYSWNTGFFGTLSVSCTAVNQMSY
jgi:Flp pilus assembly protein TadG